MFHLFTLQGKRIDAQLEHLPKAVRVHHAKSNNRVRKFIGNDLSGHAQGRPEANYGAGVYKEISQIEYEKDHVYHASEIMSSPVFTITPEVYVKDAWGMFIGKKVHHMPVDTDDCKLIGILSDRDLLKNLVISGDKVEIVIDSTVNSLMSEEVIAASPLTDIRRIAKAMFDHHIGAMPVVNEESAIVGIITRSDILFAIIHHPDLNLWA